MSFNILICKMKIILSWQLSITWSNRDEHPAVFPVPDTALGAEVMVISANIRSNIPVLTEKEELAKLTEKEIQEEN